MNNDQREIRKLRAALRDLTAGVLAFEKSLEDEMQNPSSVDRGKRIAHLMNSLTITRQSAQHFALGYSFNKINAMEKRTP